MRLISSEELLVVAGGDFGRPVVEDQRPEDGPEMLGPIEEAAPTSNDDPTALPGNDPRFLPGWNAE